MCGIVGAFAFDKFESKTDERVRRESSIFITTQLLQKTVERGKDATGISLLWSDGNYTGLKMGIPSPDFIARYGETEKNYEGLLKLWREYPKIMKVFLGHCRKSSVGNSYDNENNHPIEINDMMVIHNGTLSNHDIVFKKLECKRNGEVDTEAINHLLLKYTKNGTEPFTVEALRETCRRLQGPYSVLAVNGNNPFQVAQFRDSKPAEMVLVRPLRTVFVASEKKFLENILFEYNKLGKLFSCGGIKLPYIKKDDVDFVTLPDDTVALWDLTVKISDKTSIGDLYESKKTPLLGKKIWRTNSTATNNDTYNYYQGKNNSEVNTSVYKKEEEDKDKDKESDSDKDIDGLVWSKSLDKYKTQKDIEKTKGYKSVEIEVNDSGKVIQLEPSEEENDSNNDTDITETNDTGVENLITARANLTEHKESTDENKQITVREVDMSQDPEALKKAESFVEEGMIKYESDEEVADELELSAVSVLTSLPVYALSNRIKKFISKQIFMAGYICRKNEEENVAGTNATRVLIKKLKKATKKISTLKTILKITSAGLEKLTNPKVESVIDKTISDGVKEAKIDYEVLSDAFSVGDLEKVVLLKKIKTEIGSLNDKEETHSIAV
jgi:hypothetical protein